MLDFTQNLMHNRMNLVPALQTPKATGSSPKFEKKQTVAEKRRSALSVV